MADLRMNGLGVLGQNDLELVQYIYRSVLYQVIVI